MTIEYPPEFPMERRSASEAEVSALRRAMFFRRVALGLAGALILALVATGAVAAVLVRQTQAENTTVLQNSSETLKIIRECTSPGRPCYDRGQKRTAEVVAQLTNNLTRVSAYAAACADKEGVQGRDEILACVIAQLAAQQASSKP